MVYGDCTLIDNGYASLLFSQTMFSYCFCMLSEFAKVFERKFSNSSIIQSKTCSSYPTRASYSGQVDEFRNPMKNELKTQPCLKPVFEIISNMDANFINLHKMQILLICILIKQQKHEAILKQLGFNHTFYETNFKPANVECNGTVIKLTKTEKPIRFLNFKF